MQDFPVITGSQNVSASLTPILQRFGALATCFAGPNAPAGPHVDTGLAWLDTDTGIVYRRNIANDGWVQVGDITKTYLSQEAADARYVNIDEPSGPVYVAAANVGGTANAITLTPTIPITAYSAGLGFIFIAPNNNTGATTINISGVGAITLRNQAGTNLTGNVIQAGTIYYIGLTSPTEARLIGSGGSGVGSLATGSYTATGGETSIVTSEVVSAAGALQFFRNNVRQQPDIDYFGTGTSGVNLAVAAANGETFWWIHSAGTLTIGVPSAGSVTPDKLAGDLLASLASGTFTASGGETNITVSQAVTAPGAVNLYREGVRQRPFTDYTANGTTNLGLVVPALVGEQFWWLHDGSTVFFGAPSDNTVGTDKVINGAITPEKTSFEDALNRAFRRARQFAGQSST